MRRFLAAALVVCLVAPISSSPEAQAVAVAHAPKCPRDGKRVCVDRWRGVALRAGLTDWSFWRCVIWRESGGNPRAWNRGDPRGGSRGLVQINGVHVGWMRRAGIISSASDLYDPATNLRAARALYRMQGRRAWASTISRC